MIRKFTARAPPQTARGMTKPTSASALADQVPFELPERAEVIKDQPATGRGGVDRLGDAAEPDAPLLQDWRRSRSGVADCGRADPASRQSARRHRAHSPVPSPGQARSAHAPEARSSKHLGAARGGESIGLKDWILIEGADARIADICHSDLSVFLSGNHPVRLPHLPSRVSGHSGAGRSTIVFRTARRRWSRCRLSRCHADGGAVAPIMATT